MKPAARSDGALGVLPDSDARETTPSTETPPRHDGHWLARHGRGVLVAGLVALLAVPMVVALVALLHPRWYPVLDMAWTEMRLRDVWSHPPLLGLAGRIGPYGHQGSHPGPLSFYVLWPFYELFGASSWAMEAAGAAVQLLAVAAVLWIANRRGGPWLALGMAAVLAVLLRALGAGLLTQPWNPYLPVLWWLVFLLAVWSVLCDDLAFLPIAAVAGSFCAQTEVAYVGIAVGLGVAAVAFAAVRAYQRRNDPGEVRRFARWALLALGLSVLVWLPPVVEQLTTGRGNLSILFSYFTHPPQSPAGLHVGLDTMLVHLNPLTPLTKPLLPTSTSDVTTGYLGPVVFLVLWAAAAVVAWRLRIRPLVWLNALIGLTIVLGVVSVSRIFGLLWYYLTLWAWSLSLLMVVAVGWALVALAGRALRGAPRRRADRAGRAAVAGVAVVVTVLFAINAAGTESPAPRLGRQLGELVTPTARALARRPGRDGGYRGRYLVTFSDPDYIGAQAFGLMNELERDGFTIGALAAYRSPVTPHRVLAPADATAVVHLALGADIATWAAKPSSVEVAYADPRTPAEHAEFERLRRDAIAALQAAGQSQLVPQVDQGLFGLSLNLAAPARVRDDLATMGTLGLPAAVFVAPPNDEG